MLVDPLVDLQDHFSRRFSIHHSVYDRDTAFIISICKVDVGRIMVSPIKRKYYSEESTNFWHLFVFSAKLIGFMHKSKFNIHNFHPNLIAYIAVFL